MESELSLDLLLLLSGAVVSGLCAQLSLSAVFSDFKDGAMELFLDFGFSGSLNSALYLSGGIDTLLDLLLVVSEVVLPSNGLLSSSSFLDSVVCWFWCGGVFIPVEISLPSQVFAASSGSGSISGVKLAADPIISSCSTGGSLMISSSASSSTWKCSSNCS